LIVRVEASSSKQQRLDISVKSAVNDADHWVMCLKCGVELCPNCDTKRRHIYYYGVVNMKSLFGFESTYISFFLFFYNNLFKDEFKFQLHSL